MPPVARLAKSAGEVASLKPRDIGLPSSPSSQRLLLFFAIILLAVSTALLIVRLRARNSVPPESQQLEYLILESTISIEIGDEGFELEYTDDSGGSPTGRVSYETILNSATPQQLTFDIDKIPTLYERRGRRVLKLRPSTSGDADMALIDIKEGRLTVSPFSSRKDGVKIVTEFPPARRRTPRMGEGEPYVRDGIATAPHQLQSSWRPLDTGELPDE